MFLYSRARSVTVAPTPYKAKPMPMGQSLSTVKKLSQRVSFFTKIKQKTDILSVFCYFEGFPRGIEAIETIDAIEE